MKTKNECLVYFPATETGIGIMPAHYIVVSECELELALAHGGRDVSHDMGAWAEYDREQNEEYM